jgi:hypothetical protein
VTITATSVADSTKSVSVTIIITAATPTGPVSIFFGTPVPTTVKVGDLAGFTAYVTNGGANPLVQWTIACSSSNCGSFGVTTTVSGFEVYYTAPLMAPLGNTVTVTATSVTDPTKSVSATITIIGPALKGLEFQVAPPASLSANTSVPLLVVATNPVLTQVQWTASCGGADCGSFNPAIVVSGNQTVYTAPASIPPGNSVVVTATSVSYPAISTSETIVITAPPADGIWFFQAQIVGTVLNPDLFTTGAFAVRNGVIVGGEQDSAFYNAQQLLDGNYSYQPAYSYSLITGGNFSTTLNGVGTLTLTGPGTLIQLEFVTLGQFCGVYSSCTIMPPSTTSAPQGKYTVNMTGSGSNLNMMAGDSNIAATSVRGTLTFGSANSATGDLNINDNGSHLDVSGAFITSGPDSFGRIQIQQGPNQSEIKLVGYVNSSSIIQLQETQGDIFQGVLGGLAVK